MNWFATETGEDWGVASEDVVTREELILAVYHCARKGLDVSARADLSGYGDAGEISAEALDAISWAVAEGILSGTGKNTLSPREKATRAQTAAVLMRFYEGPFLDWDYSALNRKPRCRGCMIRR